MTKTSPKTIQIFLPDGNPKGLKIAEITSRTVSVTLVPRSDLDFALTRDELASVGVYFLVGYSEEDTKPLLYVGEAEDCLKRLKQHNKAKDFWNHSLLVTSKTQYFTKTHVKYLEWFCLEEAEKVGRFVLENNNKPNQPFVSEPMEADLLDNFETIKILVSTLGYPIFDYIKKPKIKDLLFCKGKNAVANGQYTEEGLIVFKDSTANIEEVKSFKGAAISVREKLIHAGTLVKTNDVYKFTADYVFPSPSQAASVVLARSANGWTEWKYKDGKTLDEVKRQKN